MFYPTILDEIRTGVYGSLFHPDRMITGKEDAANLYARGRYSIGGKLIDNIMNEIRRISDKCDSVTCFILFHSFGGGTGSGLTSLLMAQLTEVYGKTTKLQFVVYPSPRVSAQQNKKLYNIAAA